MSYPQYSTGGLGWTYWPSADRYSLTPKWEEWHGISGYVVNRDEESNRYDLVAYRDAVEVFFLISVTKLDVDGNETIPEGTPVFDGKVWVPYGFHKEYPLNISAVLEDETDEWTGDVLIKVPDSVRNVLGVGTVARFNVDMWMETSPTLRTRISYGTMVQRR